MGFLVFLGIVIAIIIAFVVASEFATIANEKGYEGTKYFWYTLFLGMIGALMVIALPDRNSKINNVNNSKNIDNEKNDGISNLGNNVLPKTKEKSENVKNDSESTSVSTRKNTTFKITQNNTIVCSSCGYEQPIGRAVCWKCGSRFSQEDNIG